MLHDGEVQGHAHRDVDGESNAQRHWNVEAGVGFGSGQAHSSRHGNIRGAGPQDGEDEAVADALGNEVAGGGHQAAIEHRDEHGKQRHEAAVAGEGRKASGRDHAHFEQENGQKALKDVRGEGLDTISLLGVGY